MSDWELFEAMNEAEKKYNELRDEFRARGLHNKPFVEYSRAKPACQYCNDTKIETANGVKVRCRFCGKDGL